LDAIFLKKPVDIFGKIDFKVMYESDWMKEYTGEYMFNIISEPYATRHNFLVFRFNIIQRAMCIILYFVHRFLEKINNKVLN
jgi:hypothetical protein